MQKAKALFLKFSREKVIEKTQFGEVLSKSSSSANIFINGVKVAEEENFLFSYNITSLTATIKKGTQPRKNERRQNRICRSRQINSPFMPRERRRSSARR